MVRVGGKVAVLVFLPFSMATLSILQSSCGKIVFFQNGNEAVRTAQATFKLQRLSESAHRGDEI